MTAAAIREARGDLVAMIDATRKPTVAVAQGGRPPHVIEGAPGIARRLARPMVPDGQTDPPLEGFGDRLPRLLLDRPEGRMVALVGDAEMDEGNIFESMLEGWKQGLRNCWWIIDYNRQSLDAVVSAPTAVSHASANSGYSN